MTARIPACLLALLTLLAWALGERAHAGADIGEQPAGPEIPLAIVVATEGEAPIVDEAWIDAQIAETNRLYAGIPLRFRRVSLAAGHFFSTHLVTRKDRDQAAGRLVRGVINLRIAASLMDVDEPGRPRRGVHWHLRANPRRHCILLSSIAGPQVLAHEIGHFFGNGHSPVSDNLMSYTRTGGPLFLDDAQVAEARRSLRAYLLSRELVPTRPEPP